MGVAINTNVASLVAQRNLSTNQSMLAQTFSRLSSGLRVNEAKDDPAGMAISTSMQSSIRALIQGSRNGNDGVSLLQTANGAVTQSLNLLQRMREIASQAASGTYSSTDLGNLNTEYQSLLDEIDRVVNVSTFNGTDLLSGGSVTIQIGESNSTNDRISIGLISTSSSALSLSSTDVLSQGSAQTVLGTLHSAIETVTTGLASLGASQSNLAAAIDFNDTRTVNLQQARGRIVDADFATETANLSKFMILNQSNVAVLSQANSAPQLVLQLLQ